MPVRAGRGERAQRSPHVRVSNERIDDRRQTGVCDLVGEELEEAVELVGVAAKSGGQLGGIGVFHRFHRTHLHLQLSVEALDAPQHPHGVTFDEALIEELDVAPHARLDAAARVGELEREVRSTRTRAAPLLLGDRKHALDGPVLCELGDAGHELRVYASRPLVRSPAMAHLQPFRAIRYAGAAGPLADLVAPPYDAVNAEERAQLFTRSPYNVVHLILPESAEEAGRLYREWLSEGILEQDAEPSAWLSAEAYVGPDGVERERRGVVVSLPAEPYETGGVLPHERTHPRIREERLQLLRATRVQPEPIFLLLDGRLELAVPDRAPDLEVGGSRLWRLPDFDAAGFAGAGLLIADGHHRYESAVELGGELRAGARIMALVVATEDPGLHVFPTHRVFSGRPDLASSEEGEACADLDEALGRLADEPRTRSAAVAYRPGRVALLHGLADERAGERVGGLGGGGVGDTPRVADAVGAVDRGDADVAFLIRAPRVEDVFAVARRGDRMPPKSTYFFPKPLSGLLFHTVEP
jgi:uncharacterized protein (DUF1015 family)